MPEKVSTSEEQLRDGLYVNGLRLTGGVSHDYVKARFGPERERYGEPGRISYRWEFKDGSILTIEVDSIGSVQEATLSAWGKQLSRKTFAVLEGKRIVPGQTTLGALRKQFPQGELGDPEAAEGWNFLDYTVQFGGEGAEIMEFGVFWSISSAPDKTKLAQRDRLNVKTIGVGFKNANTVNP